MQLAPEILPGSCGVSTGSHDTSQVLGIATSTFKPFPSLIHRLPRESFSGLMTKPRALNSYEGPPSYVIANGSITKICPPSHPVLMPDFALNMDMIMPVTL